MFSSLVVCFIQFAPWVLAHLSVILCSIVSLKCFIFHLSFIFLFILHLSCIIFYHCSYFLFFPSFLLLHLSIRDKKGEIIPEGIPMCFFISIWLMCTFLGGKILTRAYLSEEKVIGEMHIPRGRRHFFWENLVLSYFIFCLFSCYFMVLWVTFSIYALLLSSHHVYALDMHTSLCYCALLIACSDDHLLCYMIIVVISIWLFWCMIKLLTCFSSCLLDRNLLVTLYFSFYYLLYLEGLMCFVQVF